MGQIWYTSKMCNVELLQKQGWETLTSSLCEPEVSTDCTSVLWHICILNETKYDLWYFCVTFWCFNFLGVNFLLNIEIFRVWIYRSHKNEAKKAHCTWTKDLQLNNSCMQICIVSKAYIMQN